jgi:hypothetical protein
MYTWFSIKITTYEPDPDFIFNGFIKTTQSINATEYTIDGFFPSNNGTFVNDNKLAIDKGTGDDPKLVNSGTTYSFTDRGTTVKDILSVPYPGTKYYTLMNHIDDGYPVIYTYNDNNEQVYGYAPAFEIYRLNSDPSCYNEGTKILCLNKNLEEEYIPIENLRKGDLVKSYKHGYRKIDLIGKNPMINNPEKFLNCMYKMKKTDENGLIEDLIITGGHAILVDDLGIFKEENEILFGSIQMINDKYLLLASLSDQFVKLDNNNLYTYYHFILENNGNDIEDRYGVWANGILTDTPSKDYFMSQKFTLL